MTKFFLFFLLSINFFVASVGAQSYGLNFSSFEVVQEKRTCLDLSGSQPFCLTKDFDFSFELSFIRGRPTYFGYIFRMVNQANQNIDLLYNTKNAHFSLVFKSGYTSINFEIDNTTLFNKWSVFKLHREGPKLIFYINGRRVGESVVALTDDCFRLFFGACTLKDFRTTDVPPMALRRIALYSEGKIKHSWPLNESDGNFCTDSISKKKTDVLNPVWIAPLHFKWKQVLSFTAKGNASIAFDKTREELYIAGADTLYKYIIRSDSMHNVKLDEKRHYLILGSQSVYNPVNDKLYNFYIDQHKISQFDPHAAQWLNPLDSAIVTEYWQANKFISGSGEALYVMDGYGQLKYKNDVQRYNFKDTSWEKINAGGYYFSPRYLAALGTTSSGDTAYIMGGYGSDNGEQVLSPKYYYDFILYDVKKNTFKKLFSLKEPRIPFVFGNSLVVDTANREYYALTFPNDRFKSTLQLIRGNLYSPDYNLVGDTISYDFRDNRSFADLYLCHDNQQLLAVTLLRNDNNTTSVKVYTLFFPPNQLTVEAVTSNKSSRREIYFWAAGILLLSIIAGLLARKKIFAAINRKNKKEEKSKTGNITDQTIENQTYRKIIDKFVSNVVPKPVSAIVVFGSLEVIDRDGNNITRLFTPLLQELFLLITFFTIRTSHGISSEKLNEILWRDKSEKDANNNRSVNIAKLKAILEKLDDCTVSKESGKWMLKYNPDKVHIDLLEFLNLTADKQNFDKAVIDRLLSIIGRGPFLQQVEYHWLDDIKSDISNKVLNMLIAAGTSLKPANDAEQIIEIANCIFLFDQINENALVLKCKALIALGRHSLSKNTYEKFAKEYKHMYGEEFGQSYASIINS